MGIADMTREEAERARAELIAAINDTDDPTAAGMMLASVNLLGQTANML